MSCVNWANHEAISEVRSQQWKGAFVEELQSKSGDAPASNCAVSVELQRTPTQIVLTVELENGNDKQHFFAAISRAGIPVESSGPATPRLEKELLWQQSERILDAIFVRGESGANNRLIVLQKDALIVYEKQTGEWKAVLTKLLGEAAVTQRAPRGEIYFSVEQPERAKIVFAGKSCQANLGDASPLSCQVSAESARTGMLLASTCDSHVWWLRGNGGDTTTPDHLELTTPSAQKTDAPAAEIPIPGPVLSISSGESVRADTAVVFNLGTGNYEVYRIALACGQ
ncbi:MAG TPA: hypothetical protein VN025_17070 [Candidatus Dormibacteraeota bacterium]|jgi:hypothetical protein|nr:hypothetical protein [Candidatus Dormibacteraeota bacterium]